MRVFMTGGTGLIGSAVAQALVDRTDRTDAVVILSRAMRRGPDGMEFIGGRTTFEGPWSERLASCDVVVHLAGEPMSGSFQWSELHERRVVESRVAGTRALVDAIAATPAAARPRLLVSASTVDIYPFDDDDTRYDESAPAGDHFFGRLGRAWEAEAERARELGLRVVTMRHGFVLGQGERAYRELRSAHKLLYRGPLGTGEQWLSWAHLDDVAAAYLHVMDGSFDGPVNVVAPGAIRQADFAHAVSGVLHRESWEGLNEAMVRRRLGPFADVLIHGRRAIPLALERDGFRFRRMDLPAALAAALDTKQPRTL